MPPTHVRADKHSSFLVHHQRRVLLDGSTSEWTEVTSGVPQGSILGPLLFIIYVNDIPSNLSSPTRLFADDCTIYRQISSSLDCHALQEDLTRVSRTLNLLRRTMRDCHRDAKTKAYSALVHPILEYSAPVWALHKQLDG